jgi:hypothetical protein
MDFESVFFTEVTRSNVPKRQRAQAQAPFLSSRTKS